MIDTHRIINKTVTHTTQSPAAASLAQHFFVVENGACSGLPARGGHGTGDENSLEASWHSSHEIPGLLHACPLKNTLRALHGNLHPDVISPLNILPQNIVRHQWYGAELHQAQGWTCLSEMENRTPSCHGSHSAKPARTRRVER